MKRNSNKEENISRRSFFPLIGSSILIPFLGFSNNDSNKTNLDEEEFETLLKPDGTVVKVNTKAVNKSKVINKKVSNKSLLKWLNKKL